MKKLVGTAALMVLVASAAQAQIAPNGTWTAVPAPGVTYNSTAVTPPTMQTIVPVTGGGNVGLYLAAHARGNGNIAVTDNGAGTYYSVGGPDQSVAPPAVPGYAIWNWDFAVLGPNSGAYKYMLFYDLDGTLGTTQNKLFRSAFFTVADAATTAGSQGSFNNGMAFLSGGARDDLSPLPTFDPNAMGEYTYVLAAYDLTTEDYNLTNNSTLRGYVSMNVNVVPEPSTYLLMGSGLVGVLFAARRRRNSVTVSKA